jgi:P27 family predicted phage terminase small subunit
MAGRPKGTRRPPRRDRQAAAQARARQLAGPAADDPPPLPEAPPPPAEWHAKPAAAALWTEAAELLTARGALTALDLPALRMLCESWQTWLDLEPWSAPNKMFIRTANGYQTEHPAVRQRAEALARFERLAKQFLMTPASRGATIEQAAAERNPAAMFGDSRPEGTPDGAAADAP